MLIVLAASGKYLATVRRSIPELRSPAFNLGNQPCSRNPTLGSVIPQKKKPERWSRPFLHVDLPPLKKTYRFLFFAFFAGLFAFFLAAFFFGFAFLAFFFGAAFFLAAFLAVFFAVGFGAGFGAGASSSGSSPTITSSSSSLSTISSVSPAISSSSSRDSSLSSSKLSFSKSIPSSPGKSLGPACMGIPWVAVLAGVT